MCVLRTDESHDRDDESGESHDDENRSDHSERQSTDPDHGALVHPARHAAPVERSPSGLEELRRGIEVPQDVDTETDEIRSMASSAVSAVSRADRNSVDEPGNRPPRVVERTARSAQAVHGGCHDVLVCVWTLFQTIRQGLTFCRIGAAIPLGRDCGRNFLDEVRLGGGEPLRASEGDHGRSVRVQSQYAIPR